MNSSEYLPDHQESNMRISSISTLYLLPKTRQGRQPSNIHYKFRLLDKETQIFNLEETNDHPNLLRSYTNRYTGINVSCTRNRRTLWITISNRFHSSWIPKIISIDPIIRIIRLSSSYCYIAIPQLTEIQRSLKKLPFLKDLKCDFRLEKNNPIHYDTFIDFVVSLRNGIQSTSISVGLLEISRKPDSFKFAAIAYHGDYQCIFSKLRLFRNFKSLDLDIVLRKEMDTCSRSVSVAKNFKIILCLWRSSSLESILILLSTIFKSKEVNYVEIKLNGDPRDISSENIDEMNALNTMNVQESLSKLRELEVDDIDFRMIEFSLMGISPFISDLEITFNLDYDSLNSLIDFFRFLSKCNYLKRIFFKFYLRTYDENMISELIKGLKSLENIEYLDAKFNEPVLQIFDAFDRNSRKNEEITYFSLKKYNFSKVQLHLPLYENKEILKTILKSDLNDFKLCFEFKEDLSKEILPLSDFKDTIKDLDHLLVLRNYSNISLEKYILSSRNQKIDYKLRIVFEQSRNINQKLFLSFYEEINQNGWMVEEIFMDNIRLNEKSYDDLFYRLIEIFKSLIFLKLLVFKTENFYQSHDSDSYISKAKRIKMEEYCRSSNFTIKFYPGYMTLEKV